MTAISSEQQNKNGCDICGKEVAGRGLCNSHYSRWRRYGDPTIQKRPFTKGRICRYCDRTVSAKDLCRHHYEAQKQHGDPCALRRLGCDKLKSVIVRSKHGYLVSVVNGKLRRIHRMIMEHHIGRPLKPWEVVHHKDGNKCNNRLRNLEIMLTNAHSSLHSTGRRQLCKRGHALAGENVYVSHLKNGDIRRICKICELARRKHQPSRLRMASKASRTLLI